MILLIDNYDSFTYNLYQYLGELGEEQMVVRNDKVTISEIENMKPAAIILSPGPGRPENAGICVELIKTFAPTIPILGICLGHQALGYAYNGNIIKAREIMHGKVSEISHNGSALFNSLPKTLPVMRYHSLVIEKDTVPNELEILATSTDDNEIMAVKHKEYPLYGLQFHPESIGTKAGKQLLENFITETRKEKGLYETLS